MLQRLRLSTRQISPVTCLALALSFMFIPVAAEAQRSRECSDSPCFVHIIWDVGTGTFHLRSYAFTALLDWSFPPRAGSGFQDFNTFSPADRSALRRGDHVRVHITNYNPVSHKPLKGQVLTLAPEIPPGLVLLAGLNPILSGGLGASFNALMATTDLSRETKDPCVAAAFNVDLCLNIASDALAHTIKRSAALRDRLLIFKSLDKALKGFADSELTWNTYANQTVVLQLTTAVNALVVPSPNYESFAIDVDAELTALAQALFDASAALSAVDIICATKKPTEVGFTACANAESRRRRVAAGVSALVLQLSDTAEHRSDLAVGISQYYAAKGLIASFRRKLASRDEADHVADVDLTSSAPESATLVLDMPFGSQNKESSKQVTKSAIFRTEYVYPAVFPTVGLLAVAPFDFQDATQVEEPNQDGSGVNKRWAIKPSDKFLPMGAALMTHFNIRWASLPRAVYGTLGTTVDKNIFNNILIGASGYVPSWRTVFTAGIVGARGSVENDVRAAFSPLQNANGFAIGSPGGLPDTRKWHWRPSLSLSFKPF